MDFLCGDLVGGRKLLELFKNLIDGGWRSKYALQRRLDAPICTRLGEKNYVIGHVGLRELSSTKMDDEASLNGVFGRKKPRSGLSDTTGQRGLFLVSSILDVELNRSYPKIE